MRIECADDHRGDWARLRAALWPDLPEAGHRAEIARAAGRTDRAGFVAVSGDGTVIGFVEAALRHDYVNGCETSPVAFLEGLYVALASRRTGAARALCAAAEDWARTTGCRELASDAELGNTASHSFHAAFGFAETERVVFFRKWL